MTLFTNPSPRSDLIESLASLRVGKFVTPDTAAEKAARRERYDEQGCYNITQFLEKHQTLRVNVAIAGPVGGVQQHPWVC
jgi:hypothetical protein